MTFIVGAFALVLAKESMSISTKFGASKDAKKIYIAVFGLFLIADLCWLGLWLVEGVFWGAYLLIATFILLFFWELWAQPYSKILSNLSILLNSGLVVLFELFLLLRQQ
jgi:hypothetical protein